MIKHLINGTDFSQNVEIKIVNKCLETKLKQNYSSVFKNCAKGLITAWTVSCDYWLQGIP